jgi:DNA helicase II / ATP-dependent DNA helicase PcrA
MPHSPTPEQAEIISAVATGSDSLMISAYAGTAKSTTIEMAAPTVRQPALAVAFNKKIADELQARLPHNFKARTLNSIGHGAWIRTLDRASVNLDGRKLGKLVTATAREMKLPLTTYQWEEVKTGVENAMKAGLSPRDIGQPIIKDTEENWRDLIECDSRDFGMLYDVGWRTLKASIDLARAGHISFDDQIYCPTILGGAWEKFPRVFVDEAQDLSLLNHVMLDLCSIGPIAAVGDKRQAIYLFRGADSSSMDSMRRLRPEWNDLKLTVTFRCPRAIVARQQGHAPGYTAAPGNIDGLFAAFERVGDKGWNWESLQERMAHITAELPEAKQLAILCRNNAPLVSMAFKLIRAGVGCQMLGRDIGKGLVNLTTKLSKDDSLKISAFTEIMNAWLDKECTIALANDKPDRVDKLTDQVECLRATIEGASPSTVGDLRAILQRIFSKENGQVILSSIHRAKGLEWPLVVHLDPWRIPSKQAQFAAANGDPKPLEQESNLRYVAETRTKHSLINANMEDFF